MIVDPVEQLAHAEQARRDLWRRMVINRWLHVGAVAVNVAVGVIDVMVGSRWWMVAVLCVVVLTISHRRFVTSMAVCDQGWRESIAFWKACVRDDGGGGPR